MLDRWNKLSHDSSNSTIGIFTLSHHTKDICNPLQCKHIIQRHFWMLENKPTYPPKMKQNKPAFCSKYLLVQLGVHLLNIFKTNFHRWMTNWEVRLSQTLSWFNYEPDGECENNRQTISNDCLWHYFSKNEILKGEEIDVHLTPNHFCIKKKQNKTKQHTVCARVRSSHSCLCSAAEWGTPDSISVQWNRLQWSSLFWTPAKSSDTKLTKTKEN